MKPYYEWTLLAQRWGVCVDFASPMSAWTPAMHKEYELAQKEDRSPDMSQLTPSSLRLLGE